MSLIHSHIDHPMDLLVFFQLQLDRILKAKSTHAPGPKRPTLSQQDLGKRK